VSALSSSSGYSTAPMSANSSFFYIFTVLLPDLSRLSCHSAQRMFLKMKTIHQAHKLVKKCNYWGRFSKWNGQEGQTVSVPNFEAIAATVVEIWRYFDFSRCRHLGFFKFFNRQMAEEGRTASPCQIGHTAAEIWRFFYFSIWRPPPSWIFQIFNGWTTEDVRSASPCQSCSISAIPRPRYGDFSIFQHGGRPPSWICCVCSDHPRRALGGLYRCAKFSWNRCSSFDNMHVFRFHEFGFKTPIHAPKMGVLGGI